MTSRASLGMTVANLSANPTPVYIYRYTFPRRSTLYGPVSGRLAGRPSYWLGRSRPNDEFILFAAQSPVAASNTAVTVTQSLTSPSSNDPIACAVTPVGMPSSRSKGGFLSGRSTARGLLGSVCIQGNGVLLAQFLRSRSAGLFLWRRSRGSIGWRRHRADDTRCPRRGGGQSANAFPPPA
jgi:hypothetical protein